MRDSNPVGYKTFRVDMKLEAKSTLSFSKDYETVQVISLHIVSILVKNH